MTGQTLAEVLFEADRATSAAGNTFGATLASDPCRRTYDAMAAAVTAHLAAILADPETVEAVAKVRCGIDPARAPYSDLMQQVVNEALDDARAAIAVIAGRLGVAL